MGYCENCECYDCYQAKTQEVSLKNTRSMFKEWNWNMTPTECAQDMKERGCDPGWIWEEMEQFGFTLHEVEEVRFRYEVL